MADAYAFTVLNWAKGVDIDLARWPSLLAYFRRVKDRPAVRRAIREQRETETARMTAAAAAPTGGTR